MYSMFLLIFLFNVGASQDLSQKIVGGYNAKQEEHPYIASLRSVSNTYICGASIVSTKWILTSAYCIEGKISSEILAVVGTTSLSQYGTTYAISLLITHPAYGPIPANFLSMDIGLVKLQKPITYTSTIKSIRLSSNYLNGGFPSTLCGWGSTSKENIRPHDVLQCSNYRSLNIEKCRILMFPLIVSQAKLCAQAFYNTGACFQDTGSPLVSNGIQIGVASKSTECGTRTPHLFARVSYFLPWIKNVIRTN